MKPRLTPDSIKPGDELHQYLRGDREFGCHRYTVLEAGRWRLEASWLGDEAIVEPMPEIWTAGRLHWPEDHEPSEDYDEREELIDGPLTAEDVAEGRQQSDARPTCGKFEEATDL